MFNYNQEQEQTNNFFQPSQLMRPEYREELPEQYQGVAAGSQTMQQPQRQVLQSPEQMQLETQELDSGISNISKVIGVSNSEYEKKGFQRPSYLDFDNDDDHQTAIGSALFAAGLNYLFTGDAAMSFGAGARQYASEQDLSHRAKQWDSLANDYTEESIDQWIKTGDQTALKERPEMQTTDEYGNTWIVDKRDPNKRTLVQQGFKTMLDSQGKEVRVGYDPTTGKRTGVFADGASFSGDFSSLISPEQQERLDRERDRAFDRDISLQTLQLRREEAASNREWRSQEAQLNRDLKMMQMQDRERAAKEVSETRAKGEKEKAFLKVQTELDKNQDAINMSVKASTDALRDEGVTSLGGGVQTLPLIQGVSRYLNKDSSDNLSAMLSNQMLASAATKPFGGNPSNFESQIMGEAGSAGVSKSGKNWELGTGTTEQQIGKLVVDSAKRSFTLQEKADYMREKQITSLTGADLKEVDQRVQERLLTELNSAKARGQGNYDLLKKRYDEIYGDTPTSSNTSYGSFDPSQVRIIRK